MNGIYKMEQVSSKRLTLYLVLTALLLLILPLVSSFSPLYDTVTTRIFQEYDVNEGTGLWSVRVDMTKLEDKDLVVGENLKKGSRVILSCSAWYPTEWVYSGDGMPDFATNSSVESYSGEGSVEDMIGAKRYKSYIHIGHRRKVDSRDTGRYNCMISSPQTGLKTLAAYFHLYVPGKKLFTKSGGSRVVYNLENSPARIPCSVNHPKTILSLQKFRNGDLHFVKNSSLFYHPISGYYPKSDIPGDYICTAVREGQFEMAHYKLTPSGKIFATKLHTKHSSTQSDFINSHAVFGTLLFDSREKDLHYKPNKVNKGSNILTKPKTTTTTKKPAQLNHQNIFSFLSDYKKKEIDQDPGTTSLRPPVCRVCLNNEDLSHLKPKKPTTAPTVQTYGDINPLLPHESSLLFQTYFSRPLQESKESHEKRPFTTNGQRQPPGLLSSSYLHYLASLRPLATLDQEEEPSYEKVELKIPDEVYCSPSPCGKHAECFVKQMQLKPNGPIKRVADCKCKGDLIGNPFMECYSLNTDEPNFVFLKDSSGDESQSHKPGFAYGRNKLHSQNSSSIDVGNGTAVSEGNNKGNGSEFKLS